MKLRYVVLLALTQSFACAETTKPLKILVAANIFPKLSEAFVVNQLIGLKKRGHKVAVFALRPEDTDKIHRDLKTYNLLDKVYYQDLPDDIHSYDVILSQFGPMGKHILREKEDLGFKAKLATFFRGYDITKYPKRFRGCYKGLFKKGDLFLTNCEHFKKRLIKLGAPEDNILINYSSINLDRFTFSERTYDFDKEINLITMGRLTEKKGIHIVLKALAKLVKKYPNITYHIIGGDAGYKHKIKKKIRKLGLKKHIRMKGKYTADELAEYLNNADIFVGPSVTAEDGDQDAIPNTIKEAMAVGIPVVVSDHGGIPEMVTHGVNGYIAKEADANDLADKIAYVIEHPEELPAITKAARKTIEDVFELSINNEKLADILENLAAGTR